VVEARRTREAAAETPAADAEPDKK
jgi:hypothetical protein